MKGKIILVISILAVILGGAFFFINRGKDTETDNNSVNGNASLQDLEDKNKGHLSSTPKEKSYKDTKEYANIQDQGLENIKDIVNELDNLDKVNAFQEFIGVDLTEATGKTFNTVDEFNDLLENMRKELPDKIYKLLNSEETIDNKIYKINEYGVLVQPIIKQYIEDIMAKSDKIAYEFNKDEISKLEKYNEKFDLTEEKEKALKEYIF